ncbi:hypothetical protein DPMN_008367 [Dreissena polymorpha]|uniref:Uncharacterized protein n=1 Tax=Dreissena polymorpha TaxID=45954 RepID=A0A9D4MZ40_DREPO|nr:hypothetical protein DPMN_008367 [Dreissena polymorpha]
MLARERTISPKSKRERSHSGNSLSSERTGKDKSYKHSPALRCNDSGPVPIVRSSSTHSSRHSEFSPSLHSPKAHLSPV